MLVHPACFDQANRRHLWVLIHKESLTGCDETVRSTPISIRLQQANDRLIQRSKAFPSGMDFRLQSSKLTTGFTNKKKRKSWAYVLRFLTQRNFLNEPLDGIFKHYLCKRHWNVKGYLKGRNIYVMNNDWGVDTCWRRVIPYCDEHPTIIEERMYPEPEIEEVN